jgi:hypothetical protein
VELASPRVDWYQQSPRILFDLFDLFDLKAPRKYREWNGAAAEGPFCVLTLHSEAITPVCRWPQGFALPGNSCANPYLVTWY